MQLAGNRRVGRAGRKLLEHLLLAARQTGGMRERRAPGAASRASAPSRPLARERSRCTVRAEPVQRAQRLARSAIVARQRCQRGLVWSLKLAPGADRASPVALELERHRSRRASRWVKLHPAAERP